MMYALLFLILLLAIIPALKLRNSKKKTVKNSFQFNKKCRDILSDKVDFYKKLSPDRKVEFENDISLFLSTTTITGVETNVELVDQLLIASGAVIPVFEFPTWTYHNLDEVILYPSLFNENFDTTGKDRYISGMVGYGVMEGKMLLSKRSLHLGFDNTTDKKNVAIHEFIHLLDKADGDVDGLPKLFLDKSFSLPWLELARQKMHEIQKGKSDINAYGATSVSEFFPVASEYFFERPKLLKRKHPKLYAALEQVFDPNVSSSAD